MKLLLAILLNGLAVFIAAQLLPGIGVNGYLDAIIAGLLLGLVNTYIKPILSFLTMPLNIVTLGLFSLVVNGAMVLLVDQFLAGFIVNGWIWAIVFAALFSLINYIFDLFH